jgi:uncharacterized protein (DUF1800 family)
VSNDPSKGHQYLLQKYGDAEEEFAATLDQDHERWVASKMIWNTVTMNAPDQLRHRVAWALASIFIVSERSIDLEGVSEPWGAYYDIFVRHAFGSSFFELLREVAFSPLMALMLTFESKYKRSSVAPLVLTSINLTTTFINDDQAQSRLLTRSKGME